MSRSILLALCVLIPCLSLPAARAHGALVEMSVIDRDSGAVLIQYPARGERWIEGIPGQRYAIRLQNRTGERVLVVLSVDGVNAVSGQTADPGQAGYVLDPWQSTEVAGWRKSLSDVAAFEFAPLPDSYAARTGRPDNVGVIGIAVFREKRVRPMPKSKVSARQAQESTADAAAERSVAAVPPMAPGPSLGTGHGAREYSPVRQTRFERAGSRPNETVALRYDRRENLIAMGILPAPGAWARHPDPFPGGFVPDP
ncbi:MAG TPA: hypothetical protein PLI44_01540 [Chiayiivirga sp.]|nr:hypothetical protein [Xanthomonadaceae bacterium]MEB2316046.1 hypothetical protein [Xanthomonadaceae bacterium]HRN58917.1 hypothetical protein [Chiayiivirga sp.]HRO86446.1 hypothetical protein [Chiayiivirga sp.]HRQ35153.1 hypothetical protein [Chiayiivirga sp.]